MIASIAKTLKNSSDSSLQLFSTELGLQFKEYSEYKNRAAGRIWLILRMLSDWAMKIESDDSPRRILARKFISLSEKLDEHYEVGVTKSKFKWLARQLDLTSEVSKF